MDSTDEKTLFALFVVGVAAWLCAAIGLKLQFWSFPPLRKRAVPWAGRDMMMIVALLAILQVVGSLFSTLREDTAFLMLVSCLISLMTVVMLPVILRATSGTLPYQLGLHCARCGQNMAIGFLAYFLAAPLVAIVLLVANAWFERTPHAIETLVRNSPTAVNVTITSFTAVVVAPLFEELLFRGILQRWLQKLGPQLTSLLRFLVRSILPVRADFDAQKWGPWLAIMCSSLAFALLHANAWPAPIPLFVLSLFLGYLAYRTAGLVAPITLHATFNGVNMFLLMSSTP